MKKTSSRSGQSLIEAILAISILTVGLLGMVDLLSKSFTLNSVASTDTQATYLAAEGIELTKSLLDHDTFCFLNGGGCAAPYTNPGWGTTCFGTVAIGGSKDYEADYATTGCPTAWSGNGRFLKIDPATHLYSYGGSVATPFTRLIRISRPSDHEIEVQSIVTWYTSLNVWQNVVLDDHFYSWRF